MNYQTGLGQLEASFYRKKVSNAENPHYMFIYNVTQTEPSWQVPRFDPFFGLDKFQWSGDSRKELALCRSTQNT